MVNKDEKIEPSLQPNNEHRKLRGGYDASAMQTKLDVFFAADRITQEQYEELGAMITTD